MEDEQILSKKETSRTVNKSSTTLWRDVNAGTFPAPVQVGAGRIGWFKSEVMEWMRNRPRVALTKSATQGA
jgi:prophage regulatory protein